MRALGLLGVIIVLGVGYFVAQQSVTTGAGEASPQEQIDVVSIRQQLLAIGQGQRQYFASHGTYATLEQLEQDNLLPGGTTVRGYVFTGIANGSEGFVVTAAPADDDKAEWPVLEIDESLHVVQR